MKVDPAAWVNDPTQPWFTDPALLERWNAIMALTVAVDFDATIHPYSQGWTGPVPEDEAPIEGAFAFLADLKGDGYRVVVFSTRANSAEGLKGIWAWIARYGLDSVVDAVTDQKPAAIAYVDDRAVPYADGNWQECRAQIERLREGRSHGAPNA
jgi:hypothetical protein